MKRKAAKLTDIVPSAGAGRLVTINPATGEILQELETWSDEEVERRLNRAAQTFKEFRRSTIDQRAEMMTRAADILETSKRMLAIIITREMGKPIAEAVQEIEKCALVCRYYAANAGRFLADEEAPDKTPGCSVRFQALGTVLAVMPWNFPFWQVIRFAAPALMAGNVCLLKHASNVPQCALAIEDVLRRAGFPEGAFQVLLLGSGRVNDLIADPRISAVTLTGSVGAGSTVAGVAGKNIKKTVLELGGSDAFIVMPSAVMEKAVDAAVRARTVNSGQSCIAAKRFIIHRKIAGRFRDLFVQQVASLRVGDPMDETTEIGPLATADALNNLETQVNKSVKLGAKLVLGGSRINRPGLFFAPTVLEDIPSNSPAHNEELFGPVASIWIAEGMEEAISIANESRFGLGASAWTNDPMEQELFVREAEVGLAFVNSVVVSTPDLPFGGVKQSGYGRELGRYGIREFTNVKTVSIHT